MVPPPPPPPPLVRTVDMDMGMIVFIGLLHQKQAFSQRGDFGHLNLHIFFVYNAMGWKGIGHPIHTKCVFLDTQFWNPGLSPGQKSIASHSKPI